MALDFNKLCRFCLKTDKKMFDIYTSYYLKRNTLYCEMIANCTKIKPNKDDGLPRQICKECSRQLKRSYAFNLQCEESDRELKCYISKQDFEIQTKLEDQNEIKEESDLKDGNVNNPNGKLLSLLDDNLRKDFQSDIKIELMYNVDNDSCWDADDDNLLLEDIKAKKRLDEAAYISDGNDNCLEDDSVLLDDINIKKNLKCTEYVDGKVKGKRGRKKKVVPNGEVPPMPDSKLPHQCDICGKFLSTKSNLKAHKICHTDIRPYKCPDCPAAFRGHSALFQHKKVHTGETPYHCEYCPKQFSRRTGLVNHIRMHTGEKLYSCEICFKNFVQSAQLSIHMKRHKGDKPYLCQECGKGFPIKADLRVHQRIHNGEKPYNCHLCTKTFATAGNLSIHIRIHNKEVRYNCEVCQRGFVTCSAYNVHLKRHKGQRDHHCECGKTFYTSSALKQHKVVHTGEKKYQCKICERKFTQTSHLSRHFKRDHAKPNMPVPSSDHYKIVLQGDKMFGLIDGAFQKRSQNVNSDVKCEGS